MDIDEREDEDRLLDLLLVVAENIKLGAPMVAAAPADGGHGSTVNPQIWAQQSHISAFVAGGSTREGGCISPLQKITNGDDSTFTVGDNAGSAANTWLETVSSLYVDSTTRHFENRIRIESENRPRSSNRCEGFTQPSVQLRESPGGNIGAKS